MPDFLLDPRLAAREFEQALPKDRRKQLGQYFTGAQLSRLLAVLALTPSTKSVLDPMAGHGDLLEAAAEASLLRKNAPLALHGIEIEGETAAFCRNRLEAILAQPDVLRVLSGDAFSPGVVSRLGRRQYDLVITNPPYVRYQTSAGENGQAASTRQGLSAIVGQAASDADKGVLQVLARSYSGLADLSVPAWLLAGSLVRPNGRLALVAPATWRSRDYADVIRYFLLRSFQLEYVVEDTQPGWFSDAMVRTHLIVARRLPADQAAVPVNKRSALSPALWLRISPKAATKTSLVGAAFPGMHPEAAFTRWASRATRTNRIGIEVGDFDVQGEWLALAEKAGKRPWFISLEPLDGHFRSLHPTKRQPRPSNLFPEPVLKILGDRSTKAQSLRDAGINVGQGLRTGCNDFFYVEACSDPTAQNVQIVTSSAFGSRHLSVPATALRRVVRRQSEMKLVAQNKTPVGRVLDLQQWALPEDFASVRQALLQIGSKECDAPSVMPRELADFVRFVATTPTGQGKFAPEMSAVRTNVRSTRNNSSIPRFWYMLPDFAPRHIPSAFVPRVINGEIWTERNLSEPILVDANFSTLWSEDNRWTPASLKALFNSDWCQLYMESLGTPLGGGALKLEASHIRQIRVPVLTDAQRRRLSGLGQKLSRTSLSARGEINTVVFEALLGHLTTAEVRALTQRFADAVAQLQQWRRRSSS
jgi:tRNA G10  N-methylase Trm11